jgi:16S rRNA (guanine(966)-N(2))-methyltransferase RsmD
MRIIGGIRKGHPIPIDKNFKGRPTTDFAREGLMNTLENMIDWSDCSVLDVFTGTGAFSLEALSRGAQSAWALDIQGSHIAHLNKIKLQWKLNQLSTYKVDSFAWIPQCTHTFDVIFADPPFAHPQLPQLPEMLLRCLNPNGILVLEHDKTHQFHDHPTFVKEKKYGNVHFSFFTTFAT